MFKFLKLACAAMLVMAIGVGPVTVADAAAKKKKELTAAQKKKYYEDARALCRKKYSGYHITEVQVNWQTLQITCWYR